jgi:hypothetical protein
LYSNPPKGLHLSTDKCELLLATNGDNPLPNLHPRLAQELQQVADTYCKGKINSDGLTLLGIPIGSGTFMNNFLIDKLDDLQNTLTSIKEHVQSPATKMRLFQGSIQHRAHFHQFVDGAHFAQLDCDDHASHYIDGLHSQYTAFIADLTKTSPDDFPPPPMPGTYPPSKSQPEASASWTQPTGKQSISSAQS